MKKLHKWPSIVIAIFIILWAISGLVLNHRFTFSSFDVNRNILPAEHRYNNWNNAALRAAVRIDSCTVLFYGNTGVWEFNETQNSWLDKRAGFPGGADHHRVNCLLKTEEAKLFCGTRFGIYSWEKDIESWKALNIPHHDRHVVDIAEVGDSLWVMTRSHLWKTSLTGDVEFVYSRIPAPRGYDNKVGLFKTLWVIHSGEIYGIAGKLLVDFVALIFVFLTISGLIYFFFPRIKKRRKKIGKTSKGLVRWTVFSIKWHNKIGIWLAAILILTTFTGMFLRPPLLIAIASGRVGKIPFSVLDDGNPWYDQLRRILYDKECDRLYIASSEGIFVTDTGLNAQPEFVYPQPPASVMGYNVFAKHEDGSILVGSFTGLYSWKPETSSIYDHISSMPYLPQSGPAIPVSTNMCSGYYTDNAGFEYVFDYNKGVLPLAHHKKFPPMPPGISNARMPLWNLALEMHTARLLKPLIGDFYILFIPLFGLSALLILISGTVLWIRKYNRARPK